MAIWQFELDPIPAHAALIDGVQAIHLPPERRDAIDLGLSPGDRDDLIAALDDLLPRADSWSRAVLIWGNTRGTDLQLFRDEDGTDSLKIRIDAKTFTRSLVDALCLLALSHGWVFVSAEGAVLQPNTGTVLRALLNSPARRYVEDPDAVLAAAAAPIGKPA